MDLEKMMRNMKGRGFEAKHFATAQEAADYLCSQIENTTVGIGGSKTVEALGVYDRLTENNQVFWHWTLGATKEVYDGAAAAQSAGLNLPLCIGTVVGGAMFGDNLSFISDTTIAATKTQGVEMRDKFRVNFLIALPAALITLVILLVRSILSKTPEMQSYSYNIFQSLPYFIVLIGSLAGINVFVVLGVGILLSFLSGLYTGSLTFASAFSAMGSGTTGMFETMVVTILVASIGALVKEFGGFAAILDMIRTRFNGKKGGMVGIVLLTSLMDIATANNTVAIVMAAPIAKSISEEFGIDPKKTASLLDTVSCVWQGIIPYGAQLLIAAGLSGIAAADIIPNLYYPLLLFVMVAVSIAIEKE